MDIYLGPQKVELWYFGIGHTTGDAVVYFPEEKAAFLGDQIFLDRPQLIHSYKGGNSFEHVNTLERILETLDAKKFFSGHSVVTDREGIRNHIDWIKERQEKVKSSVEKGKSLEEIKIDFKDDETRLIESIYNEIKSLGDIRKK
jgi:glyoxylase-like metal-dependent hydrolase (beta-lactamase superfamily II)